MQMSFWCFSVLKDEMIIAPTAICHLLHAGHEAMNPNSTDNALHQMARRRSRPKYATDHC